MKYFNKNQTTILSHLKETVLIIAVVFLFIYLTLLIAGAPPFKTFYHLFKGSMGSWNKFSHVVKAWIPLTICATGLLYTFKIGLWNIGVEGQMMMGAVFTTAILRLGIGSQTPVVFIGLSFVFSIIGGGIWALIAGILKTKGGVNEIFAGLGLNFVAQGIILWLIFGPWKRPGVASMSGTESFPAELCMGIHPTLRISIEGLFLSFFVIILTSIIIFHTRTGLCLKAVGSNSKAAYLFGIKPGFYMVLAMVFAGGFAGLAGGLQVTSVYNRLIPSISSNYGYLALLVVMLANYNVWIAPIISFLFACLNVGSIQLPMVLQLDSSLSGVIQGAMVLSILAVHSIQLKRKQKIKLETNE